MAFDIKNIISITIIRDNYKFSSKVVEFFSEITDYSAIIYINFKFYQIFYEKSGCLPQKVFPFLPRKKSFFRNNCLQP
jgi:hypothetical protein